MGLLNTALGRADSTIDRKAIAAEAKRRSLADDGKTSKKERFAIRNAIRAEQGYAPEKRTRGGIAGVYDRNKEYIAPLAAVAAPFALSALVPALGGLVGGGGAAAAGAPLSLGSIGAKLGGAVSAVRKAATSPTGKTVLTALQGLNAANQRRRADRTMTAQLDRENALFSAAAPLRLAGTEGMLHPTTPDLSRLRAAQDRATNYAGNLSTPLPFGGR